MSMNKGYFYIVDRKTREYVDGPFETAPMVDDVFYMNYNNNYYKYDIVFKECMEGV